MPLNFSGQPAKKHLCAESKWCLREKERSKAHLLNGCWLQISFYFVPKLYCNYLGQFRLSLFIMAYLWFEEPVLHSDRVNLVVSIFTHLAMRSASVFLALITDTGSASLDPLYINIKQTDGERQKCQTRFLVFQKTAIDVSQLAVPQIQMMGSSRNVQSY